jgi:hypothetical protein
LPPGHRTGAVIIPLAAWGQGKMLSSWAHFRRPAIHLRFAEPIRLPEGAERAWTAQLSAYTDEIMLALARLLPAEYRGVYASRLRAFILGEESNAETRRADRPCAASSGHSRKR